MKHKKHRQHKGVSITNPRSLVIGGIGVMTYPLYGMNESQEAHEGKETTAQEAAEQQGGESAGASVTSGDGSAAGAGITN